ncbi:hypothetical protein [Deinococcus sp. KNUC1210]|uniref:helix-hairpin-helix domain-containing protein n=1 Tax=Deinococcus sp. KNUC1210 TaxID=2917691 RepID=UPI00351D55C4
MCAMFRGYGFAESHAHAFAQHSYASAWMRHHHPAAFLVGLLTEAPGMWPAATLAQEARPWGVTVSPIDVNRSGVSFRAESERSVRVPLKVDGFGEDAVRSIVQERLVRGRFQSVEDLYDRVTIHRDALETLVKAGAFDGLGVQRRAAFYALTALANARPPGQRALLTPTEDPPFLPELGEEELLSLDLRTKGYSEAGRHPLDAHRARLRDLGCVPLAQLRHCQQHWTAGLVIVRQRPPTARGFAFFVLEDRHTRVQLIISPDLWEAHRQLLRDASALIAFGEARINGRAVTVKALRLAGLPLTAAPALPGMT